MSAMAYLSAITYLAAIAYLAAIPYIWLPSRIWLPPRIWLPSDMTPTAHMSPATAGSALLPVAAVPAGTSSVPGATTGTCTAPSYRLADQPWGGGGGGEEALWANLIDYPQI